MATTDFVDAKAFLTKDFRGTSLYNHLTETILKLINDRPADALTVLESVSRQVRECTFSAGPGLGAPTKGKAAEAACNARGTWANNCSALHEVEAKSPVVQPFSGDLSAALEWTGVSFGETDTYLITQALHLVAAETDAQSVRFFGKILGTQADYYVIEVLPKTPTVKEPTPEMEGSEGANKLVYYVAPSPAAAFVALPPLKASHVVASMTRKRFLTGNLDAHVPGHPPFKGTEKDFLHAIIARVSGETNVCIDGFYERDEETEKIVKAEEFEPVEVETLREGVEGWTHLVSGLNEQTGRVVEYVNPASEEEAEEAEKPELRDLEEEQWTVGDANGMAFAKSIIWPGAVAVSDGNVCTSVYVGYGIPKPTSIKAFSPVAPPALPLEYGADPEDEDEAVPEEQPDDTNEPEPEEEEEKDEDDEDD